MKFKPYDLDQFFKPKSIAIVGASTKTIELGGMSFLSRLMQAGFPGKLYPIHPSAKEILGLPVYPDLSSLPEIPDLVMVCVAASRVPSVLEECARINIRHIHILSSGFKEIGTAAGEKAERQLAEIAEEKGLLIIGPNCMGPYCPASRLTAWGAIPGQTGSIGIISQSGTIAQRMTEMMCSLGVGVEKAVSI